MFYLGLAIGLHFAILTLVVGYNLGVDKRRQMAEFKMLIGLIKK